MHGRGPQVIAGNTPALHCLRPTMGCMEILRLDGTLDGLVDPVIVVALDGWTDAGRAGSFAGEMLQRSSPGDRIGEFDGDALFDYRDRRPILSIDSGLLEHPVWPSLTVFALSPTPGSSVLLVKGAEPDLAWQQLCADLVELAETAGAARYVGMGAVPAPVPHTRTTQVITTGSDEALLDRYGRPHERLTVPASCQVIIEAAMRDAGLQTLGLWARIPHYVAGEYPAGAHALLSVLTDFLGVKLDLAELEVQAEHERQRLDLAATNSAEIVAHIRQLELAYDENLRADAGFGGLPTGDEIAADLERFLRSQGDDNT
ncbi:MAG: PAC2 family protein [Nitriliruptorales bacterium]